MKKFVQTVSVLAIVAMLLTGCGSANKSASTTDAALKAAEVGDIITFGSYQQDYPTDDVDGPDEIEWIVLDKQDGKILVVSKYALDHQPYNEKYTPVTWETCTVRTWLNEEFLNTAFDQDEISKIAVTTVTADVNPDYDTDQGNDTQDRVFLLSLAEVEKYFPTDADRKCGATLYARYRQVSIDVTGNTGACYWWLRTLGKDGFDVVAILDDGSIFYAGLANFGAIDGVRPAMWINTES